GLERPQDLKVLLAAVGAADVDVSLAIFTGHANGPRVAADLAILHVTPLHVRLDVDFDFFSAIGTRHQVRIVRSHLPLIYRRSWLLLRRRAPLVAVLRTRWFSWRCSYRSPISITATAGTRACAAPSFTPSCSSTRSRSTPIIS